MPATPETPPFRSTDQRFRSGQAAKQQRDRIAPGMRPSCDSVGHYPGHLALAPDRCKCGRFTACVRCSRSLSFSRPQKGLGIPGRAVGIKGPPPHITLTTPRTPPTQRTTHLVAPPHTLGRTRTNRLSNWKAAEIALICHAARRSLHPLLHSGRGRICRPGRNDPPGRRRRGMCARWYGWSWSARLPRVGGSQWPDNALRLKL